MAKHKHSTAIQEAESLAQLKATGLKLTEPRKILLQILATEHGPFTMEDLHRKAQTLGSLDLVTVYRTMTTFEEHGVVTRCDFGDGSARFEIAHEGHHHHHIICRVCKIAKPVNICPIEQVTLPKGHGFKKVSHRLEFFGICPRCT